MIHHHEFWWRFFPKKELSQIYLSVAIRALSISMLGLFIPLYLHNEIGVSLVNTLFFFIFYSTIFGITTPVAAKFASKYGVKHAVLFSFPFYILFIGGLFLLPYYNISLMLIATFAGISWAFYWMGMHLAFHHASHKQHRGEEVGKQKSASILAAMIGPVLGGFLIMQFGFKVVFVIASLLLLLAIGILFASKENHVGFHFSLKSVINGRNWRDSLYFTSIGTQVMANSVIWPLLIFATLGSYISLGVIGTIISSVSVILVLLVGKYSDNTSKRKIIRWTTGFEALSWWIKAFVNTVSQIFGVTIFGAITSGTLQSPLGALQYDKANKEVANYFVSREIFICLGRILILSVVIMGNSLSGGLIFQGFASLLALLF
jgi:MFS family permease